MKYLLTSLIFCAALGRAYTQQVTLTGQVYIHNSEYETGTLEYVPNAFIRTSRGGSTDTDSEGKFSLTFVEVPRGASVQIIVEKHGYEVVNAPDIEEVVLGRRLPLRVYLAPTGRIAQARLELYNISEEALTTRHRQMIAELQAAGERSQAAIRRLEGQLNREIADRFEAEQILNQQLEATRRRLPEFTRELATVNLDFASQMYREAYAYFRQGEIEKAIETLDEAILDRQAEEALRNIEQYRQDLENLDAATQDQEESLREIIKSTVLRARILHRDGTPQAAVDTLQSVGPAIIQVTPLSTLRSVKTYLYAAILCEINEEPMQAYCFLEQAVALLELEGLPAPEESVIRLSQKEEERYLRVVRRLYRKLSMN